MVFKNETDYLISQKKYFIENRTNASYWQWLGSKGTNYSCFEMYYQGLNEEDKLDSKISVVRTIIYALTQPFQSPFFYWTLLLFLLHRFNFKKPVMKVILLHFVLRSIGDVLDKFGDLFPHYFATEAIRNKEREIVGYGCFFGNPSPEQHPLKWFITRQIATIFWYTGEIAADWYPLLRTRAVVKDKPIWIVYFSCALFNISKIVLISFHYFLSPAKLYDGATGIYREKDIKNFYFTYWVIQSCVIVTSLIYDFSVYFVLKKNIFEINHSEIGFLKKFRTVSEYRIIVSVIICIVFLPIVSISIVMKFLYRHYKGYIYLNFSFDDVRRLIANVQYFMIFIDQILLLRSKDQSSYAETSNFDLSNSHSNNNSSSNYNYNNYSKKNSSKGSMSSPSNYDSKFYYDNLYVINKNEGGIPNDDKTLKTNAVSFINSHSHHLPPSLGDSYNIGHGNLHNHPNSNSNNNNHSPSNPLMEYSFSGDSTFANNNGYINTIRNSTNHTAASNSNSNSNSNRKNSLGYSTSPKIMTRGSKTFTGHPIQTTRNSVPIKPIHSPGNTTSSSLPSPHDITSFSSSRRMSSPHDVTNLSGSHGLSSPNSLNSGINLAPVIASPSNDSSGKLSSPTSLNKNKSIANYDDYTGIINEWSYLRR